MKTIFFRPNCEAFFDKKSKSFSIREVTKYDEEREHFKKNAFCLLKGIFTYRNGKVENLPVVASCFVCTSNADVQGVGDLFKPC